MKRSEDANDKKTATDLAQKPFLNAPRTTSGPVPEFNSKYGSYQPGYNNRGRNQPSFNRNSNSPSKSARTENRPYFKDSRDQSDRSQARKSTFTCPACGLETEWNNDHLVSCDSFAQLDKQQKRQMAQSNNYCLACLRGNHFNREPCLDSQTCKQCQEVHHEELA